MIYRNFFVLSLAFATCSCASYPVATPLPLARSPDDPVCNQPEAEQYAITFGPLPNYPPYPPFKWKSHSGLTTTFEFPSPFAQARVDVRKAQCAFGPTDVRVVPLLIKLGDEYETFSLYDRAPGFRTYAIEVFRWAMLVLQENDGLAGNEAIAVCMRVRRLHANKDFYRLPRSSWPRLEETVDLCKHTPDFKVTP